MLELKVRNIDNEISAIYSFKKDDLHKKREKVNPDDLFKMLNNLKRNQKMINNIRFKNNNLEFFISDYCKVILTNKENFKKDKRFSFIFDVIKKRKYKLTTKRLAKVIIPLGLSVTSILSGHVYVNNYDVKVKDDDPKNSISYTDMDDNISAIQENVLTNKPEIYSPMKQKIDDSLLQKINPIMLNSLPTEEQEEVEEEKQTEKQEEVEEEKQIEKKAAKYKNKEECGFVVTTGNKTYDLSDGDKEILMAIVSAECDKSLDDALAVITTILNRCEAKAWVRSHGTDPVSQATAPSQFVVYEDGYYKKYMNGKVCKNVETAVLDALSGIRNHEFLSFRSNGIKSYSDNKITKNGNRYK